MEKVSVIIVAGGSGKRMGTKVKKQFLKLKGKEVLTYTLEAFNNSKVIDDIILVTSKEDINFVKQELVEKYKINKVKKIVAGGAERQDSVYNGLLAVSDDTKYVMIHDGARPFIKEETIEKALKVTIEKNATIVAVPVKDTIKKINKESMSVEETPERALLWNVQTPQSFKKDLLLLAYEYAKEKQLQVTDDSMLMEAYGVKVYVVEGEYTNIKITTPEDIIMGEMLL